MKQQMIDFFKRYWPSMIVVVVILYATLSSDPLGADKLPSIPHLDKLIHAIMMGGLLSSIVFDLQRADRAKRVGRKTIVIIAFVVMFLSILDELAQAAMGNGRSGEFLDMIADWAGIWIAFFTAPPAIRAVLRIQ